MRSIILWIWQLPQHILALILIRALKATKHKTNDITWFLFLPKGRISRFLSGVSLGDYILLRRQDYTTIRHEYGHSKQSLYFGPLYLIVIGIYSAIFCNLWSRWFHGHKTRFDRLSWYYSRWTEAWADRLGNVDRLSWLEAMR